MPLMLAVIVLVVIADQLAKRMISARLVEGASSSSAVLGIRLRHVVNRRGLWGSVRAVRVMSFAWLLFSTMAFVVAQAIDSPSVYVATGLLIGGALGNLIDGILKNGVTDFIDLRVWPVFNVADSVIVAGVVLLVLGVR
jgi:signal peptidase II